MCINRCRETRLYYCKECNEEDLSCFQTCAISPRINVVVKHFRTVTTDLAQFAETFVTGEKFSVCLQRLFAHFISKDFSLIFRQSLDFWRLTRRWRLTTKKTISWIKNWVRLCYSSFHLNGDTFQIFVILYGFRNEDTRRTAHDCINLKCHNLCNVQFQKNCISERQ